MRVLFAVMLMMTGCTVIVADDAGAGGRADDAGSEDAGLTRVDAGAGDAGLAHAKSAKRGLAYDFASAADLNAVSAGVSWWYNWATRPNAGLPSDAASNASVDYVPMLWNGNFSAPEVRAYLVAHPRITSILVMNEPNLTDQANLTPTAAAAIWPQYEALAADAGVQIVGPQITWGTMANFQDPVVWLDAFYVAYRAANSNRDPRIDALGFHWYDYGLNGQLDRLKKYGKPFWVTEFSNWHSQNDGAQIDSLAKQKTQMTEMVAVCESRPDVLRYAWFTGRWNPDPHFDSVLGADGQTSELGQLYVSLPH